MKRKFKSIIAGVIAICMCIPMAGCGDSKPENEQELENKLNSMSDEDIEKAFENAAESMEDESQNTTEETVPEIVYEPTDEILNADFSSGLIQIGNDVFRTGGYYTVDQFIAEFGDRYDMSEIVPDGFVQPRKFESFYIVSLDDPELKIKVYYSSRNAQTDENKIRIGDTIVTHILASYGEENCWYPKGIRSTAEGYEYNDIFDFLEENGFVNVPDNTVDNEYYRNYGMYWEKIGERADIYFRSRGNEENLLGVYPIFEYRFHFNLETAEILSFENWQIYFDNSSGRDLDEYTPIDQNLS